MTADPDRVVTVARSWLGTPYHDQASRDWGEAGPSEVLADGARRMMPEIALVGAGPGALILFRMSPRAIAKHVGILTGQDSFIHAYERLGVIEEALTPIWRRRIAFAFLFPQS
jgi:NlpC/P60 family putative phage cell wall peptidase